MHKQLKITAYIRTGIISDKYLPLDGVLYYQACREKLGPQDYTIPGKQNISIDIELPLQKTEINGHWLYNCSFGQFSDYVEASTFKTKSGDWLRFPEYCKTKNKIRTNSGKFKNYHIKLYYRHCIYITWYCVGDPIKIASLLRFCINLGKNAGDGWGQVINWEIEDFDKDWSIYDDNKKLMRAIPHQNGYLYGIRPSYWDINNQTKCILP